MRRLTNGLLFLLTFVALALAAATKAGLAHLPAPPVAFVAAAAVFAALLVIRALPLSVRRPVVFVVTLVALAELTAGLAYFQFVVKPTMIKGFMAAAFAPKPTTVSVEAARIEKWSPQLTAIGTLRAYQGIMIAPQAAGVITAIHFESGGDVKEGDLLINIDDSVEQADLANGLAQLKNADAILVRQKMLVAGGNTPQSTVDQALATRNSAAATVQRTRAVIAQKAIRAPFSGRVGLRNADLGQYASVGMALATLQQLDPIFADFPVPEEALATLAVGQNVRMTVDAIPGRDVRGKDQGDRCAGQREVAQRDRARRVRQSRAQASAGHVRQSDGHDRRARRGSDAPEDRDRLQPLWRQRLRGEARPRAAAARGRSGRCAASVAAGTRGRAKVCETRRGARRADRHRGRGEAGRAGGDRGADQAPGQRAGDDRSGARAPGAGRDAETVTPRR